MSRWVPQIELLEARLTPATRIDSTLISYREPDGDDVQIRLSKPLLTSDAVANNVVHFDTGAVDGTSAPQQLQTVDLTGLAAAGLSLTITATPSSAGGDGFAAVGFINAAGFDLTKVNVDGDLGRILAGDNDLRTPGLRSLRVQSLGVNGVGTQEAGGDLKSVVTGRVLKLRVETDIQGASFRTAILHPLDPGLAIQEAPLAGIGRIFIGGDVLGGSDFESGEIFCYGLVKRFVVGGDIHGGSAQHSGQVILAGGLKNGSVRGNIIGGAGEYSGQLFCASIGKLTVNGDIQGGTGDTSGYVFSANFMNSVTVHGSVIGGSGSYSGGILAFGNLKKGRIDGDVQGGSISGSDTTTHTGYVEARRMINLVVRGSVIAGTDSSSGDLNSSGAIRADYDIVRLTIRGNLLGNATTPVLITAMGQLTPTTTRDVAIGNLRVKGRVERAQILAGYSADDPPADDESQINPDAQIRTVIVDGDWIATTLAAGIEAGADGLFGTGAGADADSLISGPDAKPPSPILARINRVWIKGQVQGTSDAGDSFAITSELIKNVQIGDTLVSLSAGPHNDDLPLGSDNDFSIKEL